MNKSKLFRALAIIATAGITLAVYLLWQRYFQPTFSPCNINSTVNCDAIISGAVSEILGIPTAAIGLTGYLFILYGALTQNKKLVLGMSSFGLVFCLSIAYVEFFQLKVICPVCILCQILMISAFSISVYLNSKHRDA